MRMKYTLILLIVTLSVANGDFDDIKQAAGDIGKGIFNKIPDLIPDLDYLLHAGKNMIAGYPLEQAANIINKICAVALSGNGIHSSVLPDVEKMSYVLKAGDKNISVPLNEPEKLWTLQEFNPDLPLIMVITGWNTNLNTTDNDALNTIYAAYRCRGNFNFVAVDTADFVDSLYTWSSFNTEEIGNFISESLQILIQSYPIENITLIGHSLGSHIAGSAGRNLYSKTKQTLPKIISLDPANPCFNSGQALTGLSRGDANYIQAIHTNPGVLGKGESIGDIDFFPNGDFPLPHGCFDIVCAHSRAWQYFAESVYPGNEYNFMAVKCDSLTSLEAGLCKGEPIPMGYATPANVKGNFFLETNRESPYGQNAKENHVPVCNNFLPENDNTNKTHSSIISTIKNFFKTKKDK